MIYFSLQTCVTYINTEFFARQSSVGEIEDITFQMLPFRLSSVSRLLLYTVYCIHYILYTVTHWCEFMVSEKKMGPIIPVAFIAHHTPSHVMALHELTRDFLQTNICWSELQTTVTTKQKGWGSISLLCTPRRYQFTN
jgi:hypothetical protein